MRRQGFVDGIACAAAFFPQGALPPYVAEASAAAALKASCSPPQRKAADAIRPAASAALAGERLQKRHPGEPGVFLLFREVRWEIRLRGGCAGEMVLWHTDPAYRGRQGIAPRRGSTARVC